MMYRFITYGYEVTVSWQFTEIIKGLCMNVSCNIYKTI